MTIAKEEHPAPLVASDLTYEVDATRLLDRVSLTAGRGQVIGLIGPNGAGKSTLLRTLSGLLRRRDGSVRILGEEIDSLSPKAVARHLGVVHQIAPYTYGFTALEVVLMGRYPHLGRLQIEGSSDHRIARGAMRQTESEQFASRDLATLSGGERQRVFVARALAQEPAVLLLDEPTSNLDVLHQLKVLELVRNLAAQGVTTVAAGHDLSLVSRYCDRLVLMSSGRVLAEGTPAEVLTGPNIEEAFRVRAVVYREPLTGSIGVSPMAPADGPGATGAGGRVHVVCGGGTGARLMYELQRAGFHVTAGVLGAGDTDRAAADILGIEYVPVPAFGGTGDAAHRRHEVLAAQADWTVLCDVPFGGNNLRNLEALSVAPQVVCIESTPFEERDFTSGEASRLYETLKPTARCASVEDAVREIQRRAEGALATDGRG